MDEEGLLPRWKSCGGFSGGAWGEQEIGARLEYLRDCDKLRLSATRPAPKRDHPARSEWRAARCKTPTFATLVCLDCRPFSSFKFLELHLACVTF